MKLSKTMKKLLAYVCAIAMVVTSVTTYQAKSVSAAASIESNGVSYTLGEATGNYAEFVSQGAFEQETNPRFGFAWNTDAGSANATVVIKKDDETVVDLGTLGSGSSIYARDLTSLEIGTYSIVFTGTGDDFTDQVETVPLTVGKAAETTTVTVEDGTEILNGLSFTDEDVEEDPGNNGLWIEFSKENSATFTNNGDGSVSVVVPEYAAGEDNWATQLKQNKVQLIAGKWYKATYTVTSDVDKSFQFLLQHNSNWTIYAQDITAVAAGETKTVEITFQSTVSTDSVMFGIMMGYVNATPSAAANVKISNVSLKVYNEEPSEEETTTTAAPADETTTVAPAEESTTVAPAEESTTVASADETTTAAPAEESTTVAPAEETTTAAPAEESTTVASADETTTAAPAEESTTVAPADETTTVAETVVQEPIEVIGALIQKQEGAEVTFTWGQNDAQIALGQTYNVYIDGISYGTYTAPQAITYTFETSGEHKIVIKAALNGKETTGAELNVTVAEETTTAAPADETTTAAPVDETTTVAPADETTTAAPAAEETTTVATATVQAASYNWTDVKYLEGVAANQYKAVVVSGNNVNVVNIQKADWAAENGIYITFGDADLGDMTVNGAALAKAVEGAGVNAYLSNFTNKYNDVVVYNGSGEEKAVIYVYNENGIDNSAVEETTTVAPAEETTTVAPAEETTTVASSEETTTVASSEETTTVAPVEETTVATSSNLIDTAKFVGYVGVTDGWSDSGCVGTVEQAEDGTINVKIEQTGGWDGSEWGFQATYDEIAVTPEKEYTYKATLTSDKDKVVIVKISQEDDTEVTLDTISLKAGETYEYEKTFTAPTDKVKIVYALGSKAAEGIVKDCNVVITKGELAEKVEETTAEETTTVAPQETTTVAPKETTTAKVTVKAPGKAKIKKVTPKKKAAKKIKVSLKKLKGADGYQIAVYKTKKNAKKNKKALVKKTVKKVKVTIKSKKLKNKKKLFVKARAYKLDASGNKKYGKWSKIKKAKIK